MSERHYQYDVVVIGAGSGGFAAARTAAAQGLKTALLDGASELGGLCILRGCMPTKALLYASEILYLARHSKTWGIRTEDVGVNWPQVLARKNAMIHDFADYRRKQLANGKFEFIHEQCSFDNAHTLRLSGGSTITAAHFVIATGSEIAPPPLAALTKAGFVTSDEAINLPRLPRSLVVLGGGAVAVEFAQFFARMGVKVSMIQRSDYILHGFDKEAAEVVQTVLRRDGVALYTGTKLTDARRLGDGKEVAFEHQGETVRVRGDEILYGLGRIPNIAGLKLENAGVKVEYGRIITDLNMRTTVPHIFAAGDCTGLHEIVHIAIQQGETAAHNIAHPGQPKSVDYRLLTEVIFTDPQVGVVGLTEKRAHVRNIPYLTASYPFNDHGKSLIMEAVDGFVKLLADPQTGEIIGGCCAGPQGGELIHEVIAAMHKKMTVQELATMPHYHPTLAEIWTYPAEELAEQIALKPA